MSTAIPHLSAEDVATLVTPAQAVDALVQALREGHDPAEDGRRTFFPVTRGEMLMMPAEVGPSVGVKVVSVAPGNDALGLPRISGLFMLFDAEALQPRALIDGAALTTLRTPAVSFAAIRPALDRFAGDVRVLIFGAGPQGTGHLATVASLLGEERIARAAYVTRRPGDLTPQMSFGRDTVWLGADDPAVNDEVAAADIIVCATSSPTPLFDATLAKDTVLAIAVGTHDADKREIGGELVGRAQVVVEEVTTALREGGDVICAIADGVLTAEDLIPMRAVATGEAVLAADRPVVFKSSGMAWEDVAVAGRLLRAARESGRLDG